MVVVKCSVPDCEFASDDVSEALAIALLSNHALAHQLPSTNGTRVSAPSTGPKLERPKVDVGITDEEWNVFIRRWNVFKDGSLIDDASAPAQLFQCATQELGDSILKSNPTAIHQTTDDLLKAMRSLAVISAATGVLRSKLLQHSRLFCQRR